MVTKPDRPREPTMREWLVKLVGHDEPIVVEAERRGAARHYARAEGRAMWPREHYISVQWARLRRDRNDST